MEKKIICFANSRKTGGSCVAGKELETNKWIRPISSRHTKEINKCEQCLVEECNLFECSFIESELLDILKISLEKHSPSLHQQENYLINERIKWQKIGKLEKQNIDLYLDAFKGELWKDGDSSFYGLNDRCSTCYNFDYSILLLKPESLDFIVKIEGTEFGNPRKRVRGKFTLGEKSYILPVTDPVIEGIYLEKEEKTYHIKNVDKCRLCISLGEEYDEKYYKFIAAILVVN